MVNNIGNTINKVKQNIYVWKQKQIKKQQEKLYEKSRRNSLKINEEESFTQYSLAPKKLEGDELVKIQPYIDRLDESVRMPGVYNVALMSSYGAGKSTILRNFESIHGEYKYLNLSLGSYSTKDQEEYIDGEGNKIKIDVNEKLENSLVKQMIYREKKSKLPYSRFKKIDNISKFNISFFFLLEALAVVSVLFLKNIFSFKNIMISNFSWIKSNINQVELTCYIFFLIGLLLLLFTISRTILRQFSISKLSVGNVAIEGNEASMSYFNKYIDEILYYFEINKFNVVVIEDIDRFGSIEVFEHLKELNLLLNNSNQIKRKVTFIYAVKEDVFSKSKEDIEEHESELRTKFFDLIIPVIPVIDTFNSRDYLLKIMQKENTDELPEDFIVFLKNISLYIYDLRILTNIVNEYETYLKVHDKLANSMSKQKLFSIITLKNLLPSEYTLLQKSQGTIYELLMGNKFQLSVQEEKEKEIERLTSRLYDINNEINDGKIKHAKEAFSLLGFHGIEEINTGKSWVKISEFDLSVLKIIENTESTRLEIRFNNGNKSNFDVIDYLDVLDDNDSLIELENMNSSISNKLSILSNTQWNYSTNSLEQNIQNYPILKSLISKEIENENDFNLLLFLISNGYVAEDYSNYLSLYYNKGLKIKDKEYLIKLKSNQKVEFDYQIEDIKEVMSMIDPFDYDNIGILNKNILLEVSNDTFDKFDRIMNVFFLQDDKEILKQLDIILLENIKKTSNLICYLMMRNNNNLMEIIPNKNRFANRVIYSFQNVTNSRSNYIDYLGDIQDNISARVNLLMDLMDYGVEVHLFLESIKLYNEKNEDKILLNTTLDGLNQTYKYYFINNKLYGLTNEVLSEVLYEYGQVVEDVFYKDIIRCNYYNLREHVNANVGDFIEQTLLSKVYLEETEESFIELLNVAYSNNINDNKQNELVFKFNGQISKLSEIQNGNLWNSFINNNKCRINWENLFFIIDYGDVYSITEDEITTIIDVFLNKNKVSKLIEDSTINIENAANFYSAFIGRIDIEIIGSKIQFDYVKESEELEFDDDEVIRVKKEVNNKQLASLFQQLESVIE